MAPIYVFEDSQVDRLYPLTYTRPAFLLRCGAMTLLERMVRALPPGAVAGLLVRSGIAPALKGRISLPVNPPVSTKDGVILINARWLALSEGPAENGWADAMPDAAGVVMGAIAWAYLSPETAARIDFSRISEPRVLEAVLPDLRRTTSRATLISRPWDLITLQEPALRADFSFFGPCNEATLLPGVHVLEPQSVHLAKGVKIYPGVVLDGSAGPVIVESGTEIRSHAVITGPAYIGKECAIQTGAEIRELTTVGPSCRVGGEVSHSILLGNANKQHYGYLGQSIVGEWANLGAGTTTSNLKNTFGTVRMSLNGIEEESGLQKLGSLIGDHAKLGIGTYLSTGTVIGFGSHVLAPRPPKFVPSFAWVTEKGIIRADFDKLVAIARIAFTRRGQEFTQADHDLFVRIAGEYATIEKFDWVGR